MSKQEKLNQVNEEFAKLRKKLEDAGATDADIQRAYDIRKEREQKIKGGGDDLAKLNRGERILVRGGTNLGELSQKGLPDMSKQVGLGKEHMWRKTASKLGDLKPKKPTLGGLAAGAIGLGSSFLPKDSYAATAADTAGRIADEGDPTSMLFPGPAGEGSDEISPEMRAEQASEQERLRAKIQALQPDYVSQKRAPLLSGEQKIENQDEFEPDQFGLSPQRDDLDPIQSQPEANRFNRTFKERQR